MAAWLVSGFLQLQLRQQPTTDTNSLFYSAPPCLALFMLAHFSVVTVSYAKCRRLIIRAACKIFFHRLRSALVRWFSVSIYVCVIWLWLCLPSQSAVCAFESRVQGVSAAPSSGMTRALCPMAIISITITRYVLTCNRAATNHHSTSFPAIPNPIPFQPPSHRLQLQLPAPNSSSLQFFLFFVLRN